MNQQNNQQPELDDYGQPLVALVTIQLSKDHIDWLNAQVADYQLGPTPEFLDLGAVIRSLIHGQMQEDYWAEKYEASRASDNHMAAHCRGEDE